MNGWLLILVLHGLLVCSRCSRVKYKVSRAGRILLISIERCIRLRDVLFSKTLSLVNQNLGNTVRMGRIWNFIRIEYPRNFEYEYSVASNSIIILNRVEMACRDAALPSCHTHRSFCLLSDLVLTMKTTSDNRQAYPHISCVHNIHTLGYKIK